MQIEYLDSFQRYGILSIYEIPNPGLPSTIYAALDTEVEPELPITPMTSVNLLSNEAFKATLPEPTMKLAQTFMIQKYRFYSNDTIDNAVIYAHYGLIRSGGIQFALTDMLASDKPDYLYMLDFYSIDMQLAFATNQAALANYSLVQPLTFNIGYYEQGRRVALNVASNTSSYSKLLTSLNLVDNDLSITCKDAGGTNAATHIARLLGIAEESITISCKVELIGLNNYGAKTMHYAIIVANTDYGDETMHVILPKLIAGTVAAQVSIDYIINLQTIGEVMHLYNKLVLTDEQVARLYPVTAVDISNGITTLFKVYDRDDNVVPGARLTINNEVYVTDENGRAFVTLPPGSYVYVITKDDIVHEATLVVAYTQIVTIVLDRMMLDMQICILGSDSAFLPNIRLDINEDTYVTNESGVVTIRGVQGSLIHVSHRLGEILHDETFTNDGETKIMRLYNAFDEQALFTNEFT